MAWGISRRWPWYLSTDKSDDSFDKTQKLKDNWKNDN